MGAYMVLFPRSRVLTLVFIFVVQVPAVIILGWWVVLQFLGGLETLGMRSAGGAAFWAHIGGFFIRVLLVWVGEKTRRSPGPKGCRESFGYTHLHRTGHA